VLDTDLAKLYVVEVKVLNQAVKRNAERFPADFMFQLSSQEIESLRSQFVTLKTGGQINSQRGRHAKYPPHAFTEQGVAMLSWVLKTSASSPGRTACAPSIRSSPSRRRRRAESGSGPDFPQAVGSSPHLV
jgi:hypothetical protein